MRRRAHHGRAPSARPAGGGARGPRRIGAGARGRAGARPGGGSRCHCPPTASTHGSCAEPPSTPRSSACRRRGCRRAAAVHEPSSSRRSRRGRLARRRHPAHARHVIAADGHCSTVRRVLEPDAPPISASGTRCASTSPASTTTGCGCCSSAICFPGYAWVFPLPGGGANVGFGVLRADGRRGAS